MREDRENFPRNLKFGDCLGGKAMFRSLPIFPKSFSPHVRIQTRLLLALRSRNPHSRTMPELGAAEVRRLRRHRQTATRPLEHVGDNRGAKEEGAIRLAALDHAVAGLHGKAGTVVVPDELTQLSLAVGPPDDV